MYIYLHTHLYIYVQGFPGGSDSKESACNVETWVQSLGWEDPLEKGMATPVFLSGKFHGQRTLVGYIHWVTKT